MNTIMMCPVRKLHEVRPFIFRAYIELNPDKYILESALPLIE